MSRNNNIYAREITSHNHLYYIIYIYVYTTSICDCNLYSWMGKNRFLWRAVLGPSFVISHKLLVHAWQLILVLRSFYATNIFNTYTIHIHIYNCIKYWLKKIDLLAGKFTLYWRINFFFFAMKKKWYHVC